MDREKEMEQLRARLRELSASQYHRFNILFKKDVFEKLDKEAKKQGKSKAKILTEMIEKL